RRETPAAELPERAPPEAPRAEPDEPNEPGFWSSVRDALRGAPHDYTRGSIGRAILLLAVPMVLEMAMESVFAVTDIFFVGRLGADAVATVGLTESLLTVVYALAMGLAIGATAVVARRIGEKDPERAAESAVQAIALAVGLSLGLGPFPRLGVVGAAIATTIGRATGALFALYRLTRSDSRVAVSRRHVRLNPQVMRQIAAIARSGAYQSLIGTASWIGLIRIVSS